MQVTIRQANRNDLPAIRELYNQPDFHDGTSAPVEQAEQILKVIESYPNYKVFVACVGDEVVGTFALLILESLSGEYSGLIEDVIVKDSYRGKSVGKQMMTFALQKGKEANCYKVALSSNVKRERAHKFYESLGFERHGYSFVVEL